MYKVLLGIVYQNSRTEYDVILTLIVVIIYDDVSYYVKF